MTNKGLFKIRCQIPSNDTILKGLCRAYLSSVRQVRWIVCLFIIPYSTNGAQQSQKKQQSSDFKWKFKHNQLDFFT